jgi:hypothetical protein
MLCLSVRQPWALWLMISAKPLENRAWSTQQRGRILLHAGKNYDPAFDLVRKQYGAPPARLHHVGFLAPECRADVELAIARTPNDRLRAASTVGAILGTIELCGCVTESDSPWFDDDPTVNRRGPCALVMARPRVFASPIPYPGQLGLFNVPDYVLEGATFI